MHLGAPLLLVRSAQESLRGGAILEGIRTLDEGRGRRRRRSRDSLARGHSVDARLKSRELSRNVGRALVLHALPPELAGGRLNVDELLVLRLAVDHDRGTVGTRLDLALGDQLTGDQNLGTLVEVLGDPLGEATPRDDGDVVRALILALGTEVAQAGHGDAHERAEAFAPVLLVETLEAGLAGEPTTDRDVISVHLLYLLS